MDPVQARLLRLRSWFLVWFVVQALVGTAVSAWVLDGLSDDAIVGRFMVGIDAGITVAAAVVVSGILLGLAWLVLQALLDRRSWARTVMLVVGWITFVSGVISLLALPGAAGLLHAVLPGLGASTPAVVASDALSKVMDVVFWGWVIHVLQFTPDVREVFCPRA